MFRTSSFNEDIRLKRIVSKELCNGFNRMFRIENKDPELIRKCFDIFCMEAEIEGKSELEKDLLLYKILAMYQEIADPEHCYTFDEHGEWLLYKILKVAYNRIREQAGIGFDIHDLWSDDFEDEYDEHDYFAIPPAVIEEFWTSSLTQEDISYVREQAEEHIACVINEIIYEMEYNDPKKQDEVRQELTAEKEQYILRISNFPLMAQEILEDAMPSILFWDTDFLFIEELGPERFEEMKKVLDRSGVNMGFSSVSEFTQMLTGSERFDLEE